MTTTLKSVKQDFKKQVLDTWKPKPTQEQIDISWQVFLNECREELYSQGVTRITMRYWFLHPPKCGE
jgi:hypothetical protein